MTEDLVASLRDYEGEQVSIALVDGALLDDCHLVSGGRRPSDEL